ncbi:Zinc finger, B-box [Cynara cardunculus var. scolymus]|uniref:Zinc finger, B-box n=1 Tax=Cynara cardunculus var. scolymus TaxID=59895 RepID=A0A118JXT6_CYNCS|nr:Zinc finger, B-box [Cynara cardunculus var. scolymus]
MCKGTQEEDMGMVVSSHPTTTTATISCELCNSNASLYCQADDAFLCRKCDKKVHSANFLARRHIRCLLCITCSGSTHRYLVGTSLEVQLPSFVRTERRNSDWPDDRCSEDQITRPFLFF